MDSAFIDAVDPPALEIDPKLLVAVIAQQSNTGFIMIFIPTIIITIAAFFGGEAERVQSMQRRGGL
jgi:hypothetical protein